MAEVHLEKTAGWFYNSYRGESSKKQNSGDVNQAIEKMVWGDKNDSYRVIKQIAILAAPILAAYINPTETKMYYWPGLIALSTMVVAIPHEILFNANSYVSNSGKTAKNIGTLALNATLEASVLMVISRLAQDYLNFTSYDTRWATYSVLALTCTYFKAHLNLYESVWPETASMKVKVTKK